MLRADVSATTFVPSKKQASAQGAPKLAFVMVLEAGAVANEPAAFVVADGMRIGREAGNGDNALNVGGDAMMSRQHAELGAHNGVVLVDKSTNGTFVNGVRVSGERAIKEGDVVRMGGTIFVAKNSEARPQPDAPVASVVGASREMKKLRATIALMAPTSSTVLLLGDTGTGKEVAARAIHDVSGRKGPFIALNCAAIPDTLAESQLFGHVAGAFTGARGAEPGAFRSAANGTLFLDEIGELSAAVQAKLLRVLENHEIVPLGSSDLYKVDARVVCATHRDLIKETKAGFRKDLYARIAELVIRLPSLKERKEDVLLLLSRFLPSDAPPISVELAEKLLLHPWPFNVRELKKLAAHLALHKDVDALDVDLVAERLAETVDDSNGDDVDARANASDVARAAGSAKPTAPTPSTRAEVEQLLKQYGGNIVRIAKATGRSRKSVYRWIEQFGLDADQFRTD